MTEETIVSAGSLDRTITSSFERLKNDTIEKKEIEEDNTPIRLIKKLGLQLHPEGGYYKETYLSDDTVQTPRGDRPSATHIYFLILKDNFSAWHRLKSDEIWNFYKGSPLTIRIIDVNGRLQEVILGDPFTVEGATYKHVVGKNQWFSAALNDDEPYALVGCTVSPGFVPADFQLGMAGHLIKQFPQHTDIIKKYSRDEPQPGSVLTQQPSLTF
ncbi:MAG: cupin domain-containing protein [Gammaproteobacteria bacterium]